MEFTINKITEVNQTLRIEVETAYGVDDFGLNLKQKYLDPVTNQPRYLTELKALLEKKYLTANATEVDVVDANVGQTLNTDNL